MLNQVPFMLHEGDCYSGSLTIRTTSDQHDPGFTWLHQIAVGRIQKTLDFRFPGGYDFVNSYFFVQLGWSRSVFTSNSRSFVSKQQISFFQNINMHTC